MIGLIFLLCYITTNLPTQLDHWFIVQNVEASLLPFFIHDKHLILYHNYADELSNTCWSQDWTQDL